MKTMKINRDVEVDKWDIHTHAFFIFAANCKNTPGSRECRCRINYLGDGIGDAGCSLSKLERGGETARLNNSLNPR